MAMAHRIEASTQDARTAHEGAVALHVAWLVALVRAFRIEDGRALRLDADVRSAQVDLIRALLLACADGTPLEELRARFVEPVGRESDVPAEAAALLTNAVRLVERHLACRA